MNEESYKIEGETSLVDILYFLAKGWKTLAITTILGGLIGVGLSYFLPEKYLASASILPAKVAGAPLEDINLVAQKLRSPSFYSAKTRETCGGIGEDYIAKTIGANVDRKSTSISVSIKSEDPKIAASCLHAVLLNVNASQSTSMALRLEDLKRDLQSSKKRLKLHELRRKKDIKTTRDRIDLAKLDLENNKATVTHLESFLTRKEVSEVVSLESLLLLTSFSMKRSDNERLMIAIRELENKLQTLIDDQEDKSLSLRALIDKQERVIQPPVTQKAQFIAPVFSGERAVEPKRTLIVAVALVLGSMFGFIVIVTRRFIRYSEGNSDDRNFFGNHHLHK
ncbi:MAG: Wzz/FepE/Etk N-terminal domain-containing protein [Hyphomicrobiales bacterium]|uniref:Wzz/FepE/Etk N-terminal domain-containing protein n=1 Tax=Roseibium polysiphoniae TaxID=2571221 RepID=UPI003296BD8F